MIFLFFFSLLELSKLHLRRLDFSGNKISVIPTAFRKIETLEDIVLDHNPLTMPPAHVSYPTCQLYRQSMVYGFHLEEFDTYHSICC